MSSSALRRLLSVLPFALVACDQRGESARAPTVSGPPTVSIALAPPDPELDACRARLHELETAPELPGAPAFDAARVEILGRARGEPMVFVREPRETLEAELSPALVASRRAFERGHPGARIAELRARHRGDPTSLRKLLLREGYAYASDPLDALALISKVTLADLFDDERIVLERGADRRALERQTKHGETTYRYVDGPLVGRAADLLFGDRVAMREADLGTPLHRDLRALADKVGFERARIERQTERGAIASLRFGGEWVRALIDADGAALALSCVAERADVRRRVEAARALEGARQRSLVAMHGTVTDEVKEAFRFDRPEGEHTADHDGELRPVWATAYLQGRRSFEFDGATFPVFDGDGKPWPPEVCVDFVLDTFERTSGTWFTPSGERPARHRGRLDFDAEKIPNRRGVIAFAKFADSVPELFDVVRFQGDDRVPFRDRSRFFNFLVEHADDVRAGDVVAIQGKKADGKIHQHAILVEWTDPISGFAYGLADQMKRPRRRTWEGIMAEAPLRSLYYRVRPRDALFAKVDPGEQHE